MKQFHLSFALLVWQLICTCAFAQWSTDPSTNTAISIAGGNQFRLTSVTDGARGAIITWVDTRSDLQGDISAQRIDANGFVQWAVNGIAISAAPNFQVFPVLTSDLAGGAIITWADYRSSNYDIYAQRVNASGVVQWTVNGVAISTATLSQFGPTIMSHSGWAIIAWSDTRSGSNNADIYAQEITYDGVVTGPLDGFYISRAANDQVSPTIVSDGASGAIMTWTDYRNGTSNADIYAQRVPPTWTADGVAICTTANNQRFHAIVSDGSGGAIITWEDTRSSVNPDIYAQRIDGNGAVQWTTNGVAISTAANNQNSPTIVSDGSRGAIITWHDYRSGTNPDIYAQRVNANGAVQWTANGVAISTAPLAQAEPLIVSDGAGGAIITWLDHRNGIDIDIYARRINANGMVQWTSNGVAISTAPGDQGYAPPNSLTIVNDGAGGAIIAWNDARSGVPTPSDIYAQQVSANGNLGEITDVVEGSTLPSAFRLHQNHPNPFNPSTKINFDVPRVSHVSLRVFDLLGREVATLVNERLNPGSYETSFASGGLSSGVYFYRLSALPVAGRDLVPSGQDGQAGGFVEMKKLILLK